MKNILCVIPCRAGSTRLPGKHLREYVGATLIEWQLKALNEIFRDKGLSVSFVYAIPDSPDNDIFEKYLLWKKINCFRGSELNVFSRIKECAKTVNPDWVVRINGDNLFFIKELYRSFIERIKTSEADFITNVAPRTFPKGCSVEAVKMQVLLDVDESQLSEYDQEHAFSCFYKINFLKFDKISSPLILPEFTLSIDTPKDYDAALKLLSNHGNILDLDTLGKYHSMYQGSVERNPFIGKYGSYTIAEIGGNHEGDFEYAKKLVRDAVATEADSIKLQIYSPDLLVNPRVDKLRHKHFAKFTLKRGQYEYLLSMIRDSGKGVSASVWSIEELRFFIEQIDYVKIGSGDLTDSLMCNTVGELDLPVVLSTGLSTLEEVLRAKNILDPGDIMGNRLAILQCTSMYPIPGFEANLNVMDTFKSTFPNNSIGYSDHTIGIEALANAAAKGAQVLEYHFTDNVEHSDFRDHKVSLTPDMFRNLLDRMIQQHMHNGSRNKLPTMSESINGHEKSFRKGVYLKSPAKKGSVLLAENLITLRPCEGVSASDGLSLVGRKIVRDLDAFEPISFEDVL